MTNYQVAENIAAFLATQTGSVLATWKGKMTAHQQREMFGKTIGKGTIVINGEEETVSNLVSVCFGQDYDYRNVTTWRSL